MMNRNPGGKPLTQLSSQELTEHADKIAPSSTFKANFEQVTAELRYRQEQEIAQQQLRILGHQAEIAGQQTRLVDQQLEVARDQRSINRWIMWFIGASVAFNVAALVLSVLVATGHIGEVAPNPSATQIVSPTQTPVP